MMRTFLWTATLAGLIGCAPPEIVGSSPVVAGIQGPVPTDPAEAAAHAGPPIVQVRDFPASSIVSGWAADATSYGLRAQVGRDGRLEGGLRRGDHRLFLSTIYVGHFGGFVHAVGPKGVLLPRGGVARDDYACYGGHACSPMQTVGVLVPDALLRANRDSLVVRFHPASGRNWTVTLRRDLIDRYLGAVDSVAAARQAASLGQTGGLP